MSAHAQESDSFQVEFSPSFKGYNTIPRALSDDPTLDMGARMVYILLMGYAQGKGECCPGQEAIAQNLGITRVRVRKHLQELEQRGWISQRRRGQGQTNFYIIHFEPVPAEGSLETLPEGSLGNLLEGSLGNHEVRSYVFKGSRFSKVPTLTPLEGFPQFDPLKTVVRRKNERSAEQAARRDRVKAAWLAASVIRHEEAYFDRLPNVKKIDNAVAEHGVERVEEAIRLYGEVLASEDHWWTYRYTLCDFLVRSRFDSFLPEAEPLTNFKHHRNGNDPPEPTYPLLPAGETF